MPETRAEHEAHFKEIYTTWNHTVQGRPLHELVRLWQAEDQEACAIIDAFAGESETNYQMFRRVEGLIGDGSFFPGNHRDFKKLPQGLACTMCPAFHGIVKKEGGQLTVECEWPYQVQTVKMRLDPTREGGAVEIKGNCKSSFGISKL